VADDVIMRRVVTTVEVDVPDGMRPCPSCEGKGLLSRYDEGWTSFIHDPELAALRQCVVCAGSGLLPEGVGFVSQNQAGD